MSANHRFVVYSGTLNGAGTTYTDAVYFVPKIVGAGTFWADLTLSAGTSVAVTVQHAPRALEADNTPIVTADWKDACVLDTLTTTETTGKVALSATWTVLFQYLRCKIVKVGAVAGTLTVELWYEERE